MPVSTIAPTISCISIIISQKLFCSTEVGSFLPGEYSLEQEYSRVAGQTIQIPRDIFIISDLGISPSSRGYMLTSQTFVFSIHGIILLFQLLERSFKLKLCFSCLLSPIWMSAVNHSVERIQATSLHSIFTIPHVYLILFYVSKQV